MTIAHLYLALQLFSYLVPFLFTDRPNRPHPQRSHVIHAMDRQLHSANIYKTGPIEGNSRYTTARQREIVPTNLQLISNSITCNIELNF